MAIDPFSTSSENQGVERSAGGEPVVDRFGAAVTAPPLQVVPTYFGAEAILALVGELDRSNARTVCVAVDHCLARHPDALSLDLSGLTFCGATGVRGLRWALRVAEAENVEFRLVAPPPWLRRVLMAVQAHDLLAATSDSP